MTAGDVGVAIPYVVGFNSNMFDGVDDYVEIPHNEAQLGKNLSNGFTISAWINPRSVGENGGFQAGKIIDKSANQDNALNGFTLCMRSGQTYLEFRLNNSTSATLISANAFWTAGTWVNVLVTCSSNGLVNFYKNGVTNGNLNMNSAKTTADITTTNPIRIGNYSAGTTRTFDGSIKDVKIWNRVLTTDEIAQDYAGTTPQNGLIHHFKLGGDYTDYGSVGVTATNSGSQPVIVEGGTTRTAIKNLRTLAGISGAYMITNAGKRGQQVVVVGVQQT